MRKPAIPQSSDDYFAMSEPAQDRWNRITQTVSRMRADNVSLRSAAREFRLDPTTVARLAEDALKKDQHGRYVAKATDTLLRVIVVPTSDGLREIGIRSSSEASLAGKYWAAVQKYLQTGDESALKRIRRKTILQANGKRIRLITDRSELERLGSAGVLSFESLYAKAA